MKFLVDQNVPVAVAEALREAGHDAAHTRERGLARAEDEALLDVASAEGAVIVTFDSDFARLLALSGEGAPSVVHVRVGPQQLDQVSVLLLAAIEETAAHLAAGVVVVESERVRWRPLPIR